MAILQNANHIKNKEVVMKVLHRFINFLFWLMALAIGSVVITSAWGVHIKITDYLIAQPTERFLIGTFILLLVVLHAISAFSRKKREEYISYNTEEGVVNISVKAVNQFIAKLADEFAGIVSLQASVMPREKSIRLDMNVKAGTKIQDLSQALQLKVKEMLNESLGISNLNSIRVFVTEISPGDKTKNVQEAGGETDWQNMSV